MVVHAVADFCPPTAEDDIPDGQKLAVTSRELGNTEIFAQTLQHSPNGRSVLLQPSSAYPR